MPSRSLNLALVVLVLISVMSAPAFLPSGAAAAGPLDQEQAVISADFDDASANGTRLAAQIFRAGRTGTLDQVAIHVGARKSVGNRTDPPEPPGPGDLVVQIRTVGANELPTETILASGSLSVSNFPDFFDAPDWMTVALSSPASVTAGIKYALVLTSAQQGGNYTWSLSEQNNPYPDGAWASRAANSTTWTKSSGTNDFAFRTYVFCGAPPCLPPPATITTPVVAGGTYTISPAGPYSVGQQISASASPSPGLILVGWKGAGMVGDNGQGLISDNGNLLRTAESPTTIPLGPWGNPLSATVTETNASITPIFVARPSFSDVPAGYISEETIEQLAARSIIRGYQPELCAELGLAAPCFGPGDPVLRAQMAALIARAMGWDTETWTDADFPDQGNIDADLWRNVRTLAHYKVALGYDDGTYNPTGNVLYVQTVLFISRAMVARGYWTLQADNPQLYSNVPGGTPKQQKDRQDIATYVHYAGALPGVPAGPGQPFANFDQPATREWFTRALYQAVDSYFGR